MQTWLASLRAFGGGTIIDLMRAYLACSTFAWPLALRFPFPLLPVPPFFLLCHETALHPFLYTNDFPHQ